MTIDAYIQATTIHTIVFGDITLTEDLIDCNRSLVIKKIADEVMIDFDIREFAACMNAQKRLTT